MYKSVKKLFASVFGFFLILFVFVSYVKAEDYLQLDFIYTPLEKDNRIEKNGNTYIITPVADLFTEFKIISPNGTVTYDDAKDIFIGKDRIYFLAFDPEFEYRSLFMTDQNGENKRLLDVYGKRAVFIRSVDDDHLIIQESSYYIEGKGAETEMLSMNVDTGETETLIKGLYSSLAIDDHILVSYIKGKDVEGPKKLYVYEEAEKKRKISNNAVLTAVYKDRFYYLEYVKYNKKGNSTVRCCSVDENGKNRKYHGKAFEMTDFWVMSGKYLFFTKDSHVYQLNVSSGKISKAVME